MAEARSEWGFPDLQNVPAGKDTYCLNSFDRLLKRHRADSAALAIFVFQDIRSDNYPGHAEHLFQLLPANLVIQLKGKKSTTI